MINQIRVGETSGTIAETLHRVATQMEKASELKRRIFKRLSYPLIVLTAGTAVVLFMLVLVVPQFEETYRQAKVPLPVVTTMFITTGHLTINYGWIAVLCMIITVFAVRRARHNENFAYRMDRFLLRIPIVGDWLRDIAVLQFMDVMAVMMQSGFKLIDALSFSAGAIGNHAVRRAVEGLRSAVIRGRTIKSGARSAFRIVSACCEPIGDCR